MMSYFSKLALTLFLVGWCSGQDVKTITPKIAALSIGAVLNGAQTSGSLVYSGLCEYAGASEDFPTLRVPQLKDASSVELLREMFSGDPNMRIELETGDKIRMVEKGTPRDILDVKIRHLSFTSRSEPMRSPIEALWVIKAAPEVRAFMDTHNIGPNPRSFYFVSIPLYPAQISGDLDNVTVSQALDYVLKTYPGFWAYENCRSDNGARTVYFTSFPSVEPGVVQHSPSSVGVTSRFHLLTGFVQAVSGATACDHLARLKS